MIRDGQKGVVLQRDKKTYAIAPHIPCGIVTPEQLEQFAAVARKYHPAILKITSAARIAFIGIKEEDIDNVWEDLGVDKGHVVGLCIRSVKVCPGKDYCRLAQQNSIEIGKKIDKIYHGMPLPSKMKMAVSGCKIQCAENCIKDISIYGTKKGWTILIGGMGGIKPRLADVFIENLSSEEATNMIEKIITYYRDNSKRERIGFMIDRIGLNVMRDAIITNK